MRRLRRRGRVSLSLVAEKVVAPIAAAALGGVIVWLITRPSPPTTQGGTGTTTQVTTAEGPRYPPTTLGAGTERLALHGRYGRHRFTARGAVAVAYPHGLVGVQLHPQPVTCDTAFLGTPEGYLLEVWLEIRPRRLLDAPLGRRLHATPSGPWSLTWTTERANLTNLDSIERGEIVLTAIDTHLGGYWRGRVVAPRSRTLDGRIQALRGTFAARWCDDPSRAP